MSCHVMFVYVCLFIPKLRPLLPQQSDWTYHLGHCVEVSSVCVLERVIELYSGV